MGCGCGGGGRPPVPVTSGDLQTGAPGAPRFKVIRGETDPETGEPLVEEFADYRSARIAQANGGGKLRAIRDRG